MEEMGPDYNPTKGPSVSALLPLGSWGPVHRGCASPIGRPPLAISVPAPLAGLCMCACVHVCGAHVNVEMCVLCVRNCVM